MRPGAEGVSCILGHRATAGLLQALAVASVSTGQGRFRAPQRAARDRSLLLCSPEVKLCSPSPTPRRGSQSGWCWGCSGQACWLRKSWVVYISIPNSRHQPWGITSQNHVAILAPVGSGPQSAAPESPPAPMQAHCSISKAWPSRGRATCRAILMTWSRGCTSAPSSYPRNLQPPTLDSFKKAKLEQGLELGLEGSPHRGSKHVNVPCIT